MIKNNKHTPYESTNKSQTSTYIEKHIKRHMRNKYKEGHTKVIQKKDIQETYRGKIYNGHKERNIEEKIYGEGDI